MIKERIKPVSPADLFVAFSFTIHDLCFLAMGLLSPFVVTIHLLIVEILNEKYPGGYGQYSMRTFFLAIANCFRTKRIRLDRKPKGLQYSRKKA